MATNLKGFDKLCDGGLLNNASYLVSGNAGTGKSLFCLEFMHNALKNGEKCIYISFEENLEDLRNDGAKIGLDFSKYEEKEQMKFAYYFPYEVTNFDIKLVNEITTMGATRIVIDSSSAMVMGLEDEFEVRKELYSLVSLLKKLNCTGLITSEIPGISDHDCGELSRFGVEEFVVDGAIKFYISAGERYARITKMRSTDHEKMPVQFKITNSGFEFLSKIQKSELKKR
ncbi:MAG: ATPase domain-containing protein [Nanoarchaeota archaeon]|nr:ATPase domain-containing protein [Nanoarchaeota archaeon]